MSKTYENIIGKVWKPVKDWPSYQVSNLGQVRRSAVGGNRAVVGRCLKPILKPNRYTVVTLYQSERIEEGDRRKWNRSSKQVSVHRVVMEAFCGACPSGLHVNHRDGDKTNNRLSNLEYVTPTGNMLHSYRIGTRSAKGSKNGKSKLNEDKVREIRRLAKRGRDYWDAIADRFEISIHTVKHIVNRTRWAHVK